VIYKTIGQRHEEIPAIGQGCMGIGGYFQRNADNDRRHLEALKLGIDMGMTLIDTAEVYGNGHSEEIAGRAARNMRDKIFLATKVSPENLSYNDLLQSAEESLRRLGTDYIDLFQVHWPNPGIPIEETMEGMKALKDQGKIRYVGVSNFSINELRKAQAAISPNTMVSIQVEYNLFDRTIEENILPYCEEQNLITIAYSPLDQGSVAMGSTKIEKLRSIAEKYRKSIAQIALNWLIRHPSVVVIPKAVKPDHIKANAEAADFRLSEDDFAEIGDAFAQKIVHVPVENIFVIDDKQRDRRAYQTMEDAMENRLGFVPSPAELAGSILAGEILKPVRVRPSKNESGEYEYDLVEGRIRYWAWVIAHGGKKPVPVYIRD